MKTAAEMTVQEFENYLKRKRKIVCLPLRKDVGAKWRKNDWGSPITKRTMQRRRTL